jgi:hypothetical protein
MINFFDYLRIHYATMIWTIRRAEVESVRSQDLIIIKKAPRTYQERDKDGMLKERKTMNP